MKEIKTIDAVGHILCHDITQIVPGKKRGVLFSKGHKIKEEDIPQLLSVGKERLFVWEEQEGMLHENDAAQILYEMCKHDYMEATEVKEGKIEVLATQDGLLKVDKKRLQEVNRFGEMMIASRHGNTRVNKGEKIAGTRIIPLMISKEKMKEARKICKDQSIFRLLPFQKKKVAIFTTGNEVYHRRIQDAFTPVLIEKLREFESEVILHEIYDDDSDKITKGCIKAAQLGANLILCTGGMSVDPDDKTPLGIKNTGARIVSYGAPVLPGSMFLLAYLEQAGKQIPICGLPGCVMYAKKTIFDLVLPRLMAEDEITAQELSHLGEGGLCLDCPLCTFPNCGFGKGW